MIFAKKTQVEAFFHCHVGDSQIIPDPIRASSMHPTQAPQLHRPGHGRLQLLGTAPAQRPDGGHAAAGDL